mgnify:CR=1 FL=1
MKLSKIKIKARIRKGKKDIKKKAKNIKKKLRARSRKGKKDIKKNFKNFFEWIKGAELIELKKSSLDQALTQSGTILSIAQSPPPITFPARADAILI